GSGSDSFNSTEQGTTNATWQEHASDASGSFHLESFTQTQDGTDSFTSGRTTTTSYTRTEDDLNTTSLNNPSADEEAGDQFDASNRLAADSPSFASFHRFDSSNSSDVLNQNGMSSFSMDQAGTDQSGSFHIEALNESQGSSFAYTEQQSGTTTFTLTS